MPLEFDPITTNKDLLIDGLGGIDRRGSFPKLRTLLGQYTDKQNILYRGQFLPTQILISILITIDDDYASIPIQLI